MQVSSVAIFQAILILASFLVGMGSVALVELKVAGEMFSPWDYDDLRSWLVKPTNNHD